ncbi:MAG: hypothetical protein AAGA99_10470 [Actinomycetota bacterium]
MASTTLPFAQLTAIVVVGSEAPAETATGRSTARWRRLLAGLLAAVRSMSVARPTASERALSDLSPVDRRFH